MGGREFDGWRGIVGTDDRRKRATKSPMPNRTNPFTLLERTDKWYLAGGRATLYAPLFPAHLDTPGFWDEVYFADIRLERLFCLLLLDLQGRPLTLRRALRRWTPDRLLTLFTVEGVPALRVQEERVITPNDTLACRLTLTNSGDTALSLHILLWSLQPQVDPITQSSLHLLERDPDALSFARRIPYLPAIPPAEVYGWGETTPHTHIQSEIRTRRDEGSDHVQNLFVALGASRMPDSFTVNLAERTATAPLWQSSVFPEKFHNSTLAREMPEESEGKERTGEMHLALHYVAEAPPGGSDTLTLAASIAFSREEALDHLRDDMTQDVAAVSRADWQGWFDSVPNFSCSDPYLERSYWYRWYGLRLNRVDVGIVPLTHPCVFEGIGGFRSHVSFSAICLARETSWRHNPSLAMGCLENLLEAQCREEGQPQDGFLPGHLALTHPTRGFYHTDWGGAALQIFHLTGDRAFVRRITPALMRYAEYCERERDREQSGLCDVWDQGETGQEYMSRYLFAAPDADDWHPFQLKGVDASYALYRLRQALSVFARLLGKAEDARWWADKATATRLAIRERMWDPKARLFKDVHPATFAQSPYKAAVGFYPFQTDLATEQHLPALAHLHNPATFGTPFPVPSSSVDDPYFDAAGAWKGERTNCPWNGRAWPMASAQAADGLAHAARTLAPELRAKAADLIRRCLHMMFHDNDPARPSSYEHYNPFTGRPSLYRGVDDYMHSLLVDLILRHVVGVQPEPGADGALIVDPLPFGLDWFYAENILVRGHRITVSYDRAQGFTVKVDGRVQIQQPAMERAEIPL